DLERLLPRRDLHRRSIDGGGEGAASGQQRDGKQNCGCSHENSTFPKPPMLMALSAARVAGTKAVRFQLRRVTSMSHHHSNAILRRTPGRAPTIEALERRVLLSIADPDTTFGAGGSVTLPFVPDIVQLQANGDVLAAHVIGGLV